MANTDRFYNAPEGPQTEPVDELPRRAHYEIHSDPDMFGGLIAKGFSELGQGLTTAGNVYGQIASDQATNNFMGNLSNLRSGFENTRGQDTMEQHQDYIQNVQKAFEAARSTVPPGQQPEFDRFALRYKFNAESSAASHLAQQSNAWGQSVAVSKEQQAVSQISATPNDDDNFKLNSESMAKAAVNGIQLKMGITDLNNASPDAKDMVRNVYDQALAKAWYARIEAVRQSNPAQALQWQQQNAAILGKLGSEVQNQMRGYEEQQQIQNGVAKANAAIGGGAGPSQDDKAHAPVGHMEGGSPDVFYSPNTLAQYKARTAQIESASGRNEGHLASYYQFEPGTWAKVAEPGDVRGTAAGEDAAMNRLTAKNAKVLSYGLGRAPTLAELYLAHQQGAQGALHLLAEPSRRAGDIVGNDAVSGNGGNPNGPASAFVAHVENYYSNGKGGAGKVYYAGTSPAGSSAPAVPTPTPASLEVPAGGTGAAPVGEVNGGLGSTPPAIGTQDQGGLSGPTPQSQPSIQPAVAGGGGLGGAQPVQQGGTEVSPDQQSVYDIARDKVSQAMMHTMQDPEYNNNEHLRDQILAEQEKQLRYATFAAEQDRASRARFSNEAVDRSLKLALGTNGGPRDPQGGFNALTDAFKRGLIDEPAYERGQAAIARATGEEDKTSFGPGWSDFVTGKTPVHSEGDLQALLAHGDLTWNGYQHADQLLARRDKPDESGFLTQKKYSYEAAENYLKWELKGTTPGSSIVNPNGPDMMVDFSKIFETQELAYRKEHGNDMTGFDLFDKKKLHAVLDGIYSQRQKDKDMGNGGLTKPQADEEDQLWAQAPKHPPAPQGFDQGAWQTSVASPPLTPDKFPLPHEKWDSALRILAANQTPTAQANFDSWFGPQGTLATGPPAADILRTLKAKEAAPEPAAPPSPLLQGQTEAQPGQPAPGMAVAP